MFLFIIPLCIGLFFFYHFYWKRRNLPPGPTPLPLFGNMLEVLKKEVYKPYLEWHNKYGPIHTYWQGELPIVVVTDYKMINETFVKDADAYIGRPHFKPAATISTGRFGVIGTDGDLWRDQRRFALHVFRNFGLGKNLMQERVFVEIQSLIEKVQVDLSNGVKEHNMGMHIDVAVGSIINNLLFSYRFEGEKLHEFYELKRLVTNLVRTLGHPFVVAFRDHMEIVKYIPGIKKHYYSIHNAKMALYDFYSRQVDEHQARIDHDSEPTDYVEAFLREKDKKGAEGNPDAQFYSVEQLLNMCADLWLAGQETTSNTLGWGVIYIMLDQKIQAKLQKELDTVIGSDRMITMDDKPKLHYASAVVNEIQRIANLVPVNVLHTTTRDVKINGYDLPKGTIITPQVSVVLYDDKVFPNPHEFDPTRFLDENGQWKRVEELIPFSVGKRQCLGEGLARMELFLFTINIFNHFKIKAIPNKQPNMNRVNGGTIAPRPFECIIEKRY